MSYAALYSGGKDSTLALWMAQQNGIDVSKLITVFPKREDSYMFHKPNIHLVPKLAESLGVDLIRVYTKGEKEKEINDLKKTVSGLEVDGLITGAVASEYQSDRVKKIADEFGIDVYQPLWGIDQNNILDLLIKNKFNAVIVSVAAMGLNETWLGREIDENCASDLRTLEEKYRINVAGEGGEYETLVLAAPNYRYNFKIIKSSKEWDGKRGKLKVEEIERV